MPQTRRMTVLQVLPALESGGVERGVLEVADALVRAGHRSLVISAGGRLVQELIDHGSEHIHCGLGVKSPLTLRWVPWLRQRLLRERVDVVDIHSRLPGWMTMLAWKSLPQTRRPGLVTSFHGLHSVSRYSGIMCRGQRVIVVSETTRQHVLKHYSWVPGDRIRLIPRGVDSVEFPRGYRCDDVWKSRFFGQYPQLLGPPLLTLAGRISRLKGHRDFLLLLAGLRDAGISVHGLIVGAVDAGHRHYLAELQALISELGLTDRVTMTGHRDDLKQIYAMSAIVLSLSQRPESFGRTVAEALSIGRPVVGYSHGGVGELLSAQFPTGAVDPGDVNALTQVVAGVLSSAQPLSIAANPFDKAQMLKETLDVYQEFMDGRHAVAA